MAKFNKLKYVIFLGALIFVIGACSEEATEKETNMMHTTNFNGSKWKEKHGNNYTYRPIMVDSVLHNDSIRHLTKSEILQTLGTPDRENNNYFYYLIEQNKLGFVTLHTKNLVIKFATNDSIEWIKLHE
ncbi:hypothetical protein [Neptunitalea lumnitzerae]|uniref:Lipoprotein SmpA/OmlA domain-containing protein n=1 Tax=Neptunitalea lumnitzerae TaxID=2965509 RepID=A0ABQ5MLX2_9FLAO|nr:hypothetical protein [Neptunitalea sp. Y10]GLB50347.1 hypothetical protein Y10_27150 [Neptunitalea sp. Y10]